MKRITLFLLIVLASCGPVQESKPTKQRKNENPSPDIVEDKNLANETYEDQSYTGKILAGEHKLRRFYNDTVYFKVRDKYLTFLFRSNRIDVEEYLTATLAISKVRVIIHDSETPYVKFRWEGARGNSPRIESIMENYVIYMEVYCRESQIKW